MPISANQTSLWDLPAGGTALIAGINGGIDAATQRLIDIGFREGQRVTCLLTPGFGAPRVFAVGGATYSLNRAIAKRVQTIEPDV